MARRVADEARRAEIEAARVARGDVTDVRVNGRRLTAGDVITFTGARGMFKFYAARVVDGEVQWLQVTGFAKTKNGSWRYFTPDRLKVKKQAKTVERVRRAQ